MIDKCVNNVYNITIDIEKGGEALFQYGCERIQGRLYGSRRPGDRQLPLQRSRNLCEI